jgi:hypothetical protein
MPRQQQNVFQDLEQLNLQPRLDVADLVEKQRAPRSRLDETE